VLRALGAEVARLHRAGYIHGDLTPFNVLATADDIAFIDHERTKRTPAATLNVTRSRMRNLVQLGHFDLAGVSRTDKLRVFASYAKAMGWPKCAMHRSLVRLTKMIDRRRKRDLAIKRLAPQPARIVEEGAARS
jgi:aminoglycoside phosphotransferase (APT) family kinase protein